MFGEQLSKTHGTRDSSTLLELKNQDTYGTAEARAIVATLYEEYRRNAPAFHALGLADVEVGLGGDVRVSSRGGYRESSNTGMGRLVALADALHTTGDLRIIYDRAGAGAAYAALEAYASCGPVLAPPMSAQLARHSSAAASVIPGLSYKAGEYCRASLRRVRDIYALSALLPERDRAIMDMVVAVVLEASHRVDDYYDNDAKWHTYGYAGPEDAITSALLVVEQLLAGKPYQAEALRQIDALLAYLEIWVGGDSRASDLDLSNATQRILECNADLYRRFFDLYSLATATDKRFRPVFESFGALIWVLDDWRDVEADSLNDHFNVFTPYRMDVQGQVAYLEKSFGTLLEVPSRMLDRSEMEELLLSAGTTEVMRRYLSLPA